MSTIGLGGSLEKLVSKETRHGSGMCLEDGSRVAVIGGGPAGSLFSCFLLRMADSTGMNVHVDVYEPRHFTHKGPAGCNHCGGIISESLVQILATEDINLPPAVVQRGIDSYTLHFDVGTVQIETPLHEKRIAAVYRGNGPRQSEPSSVVSFDGYLLDLAVAAGAKRKQKLVVGLQATNERLQVTCPDLTTADYDLVAVATGINSNFLQGVEGLELGFKAPKASTCFISEFHLGKSNVQQYLGSSMHVFLLDLARLKFAALIPKGDLVTIVVLGDEIDEKLIRAFFNAPEVRNCFPGSIVPPHVCHCFPRINVQSAVQPFADRLVMIGDTGTSRLYKDGIGAAYKTAKAAARTAIFHGLSAEDFREHYLPACRRIESDNSIGKLIFAVTRQIQKRRIFRRAVFRMTSVEQHSTSDAKRMSGVLWDVFTGSAPYRNILLRTWHPLFILKLAWNLVAGNWVFTRNPSVSGPKLQG